MIRAALGFDQELVRNEPPEESQRREWMQDPAAIGRDLADAREALRFVLAYRTWYDQRRGWLPNPQGATAVVLEDGFKNLNAIRLDKDERITIAHRALGIERFSVYPLANGSFGVADSGTKLGLSMKDEQVDINTLFQKHEAAAAQTTGAGAVAPAG